MPLASRSIGAQKDVSLVRATLRWNWMPQRCGVPSTGALKRSCESGIRNSAVQPSESTLAAPSQIGSQLMFSLPSSYIISSIRAPRGLRPKMNAVRRSK
ncbi:MAG: hypothetical protein FIB01_03575 [Gemmatimonadetes bacterium]|nr:hypothetical protein [Gemmatimonadota bacterium]